MRFRNKHVIVTGGASGIGAATARGFASEGALVSICDIAKEQAVTFASELSELGFRASGYSVDVTNRLDVENVVFRASADHGVADVLVNCAGIRDVVSVLDLKSEEWQHVLQVNLSGSFYMSQSFARAAIAAAQVGAIVNVASAAGILALPNRAAYVSAKHAIVGLTKEMAIELGRHGIRVNAVAPGLIRTPMTERSFSDPALVERLKVSHPLGRAGTSEEVSAAIKFLASDAASFISGAILPVDGGYTAGKGW